MLCSASGSIEDTLHVPIRILNAPFIIYSKSKFVINIFGCLSLNGNKSILINVYRNKNIFLEL